MDSGKCPTCGAERFSDPTWDAQVADLANWFRKQLADQPVSSNAEAVLLMIEAFNVWLDERDYELTDSQIDAAFRAAKDSC